VQEPPYSAERDSALDGVRGLAVLMILLLHGFTVVPQGPLTQLLHNAVESMFVGVDLFFVLSGFLITSILLRTRGGTGYFRRFYWRRSLRIFPAYYAVVLATCVLLPLRLDPLSAAGLRGALPEHLFYVQNLVAAARGPMPPELSHLWSLAIEEQFYLLWPLTVLLVPPQRLGAVCLGLFLASCLCDLAFYLGGASWLSLYVFTPCHVEGLAAGAWIAVRRRQGDTAAPGWLRGIGLFAGLALLGLALAVPGVKLFERDQVVPHNLLASLAFAALLWAVVAAPAGSLLRGLFGGWALRFLGRYSYGIYLLSWGMVLHLQYPLARRLGLWLPGNTALFCAGLAVSALSVLAALLMFHLLERPLLGLKERGPGRGAAATAADAAPTS
jgi:peptidoglycan/LPS O-acetylase OafA/YrhL